MHYSSEKQKELLRDWKQNKNQSSLNDLIMSNKRLVMKEATSLIKGNKNIELEDLIQEGYVGLSIAADKFDLDQDNNFVTYAMFWVRQRIKSYIVNNRSVVRLGTTSDNRKIFSSLPATLRDIDKEFKDDTLTTPQRIEEASKRLNVKKESLRSMMNILSGYDKSFDQKISGDDDGRTLLDITPNDLDFEESTEVRDYMEKFALALSSIMQDELTEEESYIITRRFLLHEKETYDIIAKSMRVSRQYIRTREAFALKKIKAKLALRFNLKREDFFGG